MTRRKSDYWITLPALAADAHGSLSLTGSAHTMTLIVMGSMGYEPAVVILIVVLGFIPGDVETRERLLLPQGRHEVDFPKDDGMRFHTRTCRCMKTDADPRPGTTTRVGLCIARRTIPSAAALSVLRMKLHFGREATNEATVLIRLNRRKKC